MLNSAKLAKNIFGLHQMLGMLVPLPDIEVTLDGIRPKIVDGKQVMLAHITMGQATELADPLYELADQYGLLKWFTGPVGAVGVLITTAAGIYGPKFMTAKLLVQASKAQQPPAPASAADMMHTPAPAQTETPGVYKYGP